MIDLQSSVFLRALKRQPVERTPIWIMRQAGRYLPEYRAVREKAGNFLTLCKTPQLACEVTLQPLRRFDLDASILFSDILTIPDAMGLGLHFIEGEGPRFEKKLRNMDDIKAIGIPDMQTDLGYVMDAASLIRHNLPTHIPLIGFSGSPWTLACYMLEGGSSADFRYTRKWMYDEPVVLHTLLAKLAKAVALYLEAQIKAGVNALMLFDTWGGILSEPNFKTFSLQYLARIVHAIKDNYPEIPVILFTKGGGAWLSAQADTGCDALSLDWTVNLGKAREEVGNRVALQGNLDPAILLTSPETIRQQAKAVLQSFGEGPGHIFNLGHGITPDVPPEHVQVLVEAVHTQSG